MRTRKLVEKRQRTEQKTKNGLEKREGFTTSTGGQDFAKETLGSQIQNITSQGGRGTRNRRR